MDAIEKLQAEEERRQEAIASTAEVGSAALADGARSDIGPEAWPVTIIGCIRGADGWYLAGYDARKETVVPLEKIQDLEETKDALCEDCEKHEAWSAKATTKDFYSTIEVTFTHYCRLYPKGIRHVTQCDAFFPESNRASKA